MEMEYCNSDFWLDLERAKLEQQEKKLVNDIKTTAKKNQMGSVKVMAKDLVRTR